jgi:hypothetical protein
MSSVTETRLSIKRPSSLPVFRCELTYGTDRYLLAPLTADPDVATQAFRLCKNGVAAVYDVALKPAGFAECDCQGFERWQRCKHVNMLVAIGCLPMSAVRPEQVLPVPVQAAEYRSAADQARNDPEAYARLQTLWVDPREAPLGDRPTDDDAGP